ncbi:MAG: hypothetical protein A2202_01915 [Bdellovibrionales bacterium RIFOXYA1_FULL_36_14]|nr:MAG: hypothetical protein A2202_01915 [Bdellovibrionales bacterium RIFOXYA1_FULL_36_14]
MTLSDISIKRPIGVLVLTLMVVVLGMFFLRGLSVDLLPRVTYPLVKIVIDWKGASPEEIEENILKKVESSIATTEDAIKVTSSAIEGNASIDVYFEFGKDMDVALADTRTKLDLARNQLPPGVDDPKIFKADPSQLPILTIAIYSQSKDERDLRDWAENDLSNHFLGIPGLGAVVTSGGKIREIQVVFDQQKIQKYELSTEKLLSLLRLENIEYPAGRINDAKTEYSIRVFAKYQNVTEIENIIIANRDGRLIKIRDVAQVTDTHEEQRVLTRFNGKPSVTLSFLKQPNANTVEVVSKIMKRAQQLANKKIIPSDVQYDVISNQAYYIENSISNVSSSAIMGAILAMMAIWFFLHNIRRTLVIAIAIPVSICGTFILMGLFGVTLNIFSLGGLVLAVGMLVDNSVVMLENITRHQNGTLNFIQASHKGSNEVISALIASTLTNIAAIVPFFFIKGIASLLFRDLVITVTVAFIISLIVSLTVVPCASAYLFKKNNLEEKKGFNKRLLERLVTYYQKTLSKTLQYRTIVITGVVVFFILSLFLAGMSGREFLPKIDDGTITIKIKLPTGSTIENTDSVVKKVEASAKGFPGVKRVSSMVGGIFQHRNVYEKANEAEIIVELVEKAKRTHPTSYIMKKLQKSFKENPIPKAQVKVMITPLRGIKTTSTSDIDIKLKGYELNTLFSVAKDVMNKIENVEGINNLDISLDLSRPEIHVFLNREKLNDFGLTAKDAADAIRIAVDGLVSTQFTDRKKSIDYDLKVLAQSITENSKQSIEDIFLYPSSGVRLKLKEVARIEIAEGAVQIARENQVRTISVTADATGKNVGKTTDIIKKRLAEIKLPQGYFFELGGEEEAEKESKAQLLIVIALAIFLLFVVMAVQYDSLSDPLIIMLTLPLALTGSLLLLVITKTPFGAMAFLGLIMLVGIVVNNAIILVEYLNNLTNENGEGFYKAVVEGASLRLRPILMTSITTIIGLLPLAFGWGEGLEMLKPLAITVVGGLTISTLLTLFVIPCVYTVFHKSIVRK